MKIRKVAINVFVHGLENIGGIYARVYDYLVGFERLGVPADVWLLDVSPKNPNRKLMHTFADGSHAEVKAGKFGLAFQLRRDRANFYASPDHYLAYGEKKDRLHYRDVMSQYDVVIFPVPCPHETKANMNREEATKWYRCYDIPNAKIITVMHDNYYERSYQWFSKVFDKVYRLACMYRPGFLNTRTMPIPTAWILSPIDTRLLKKLRPEFSERPIRLISTNWFKGWKHMDELVKSAPYVVKKGVELHVYGGGIEYAYMTSMNKYPKGHNRAGEYKVKPKYIYPDDHPRWPGQRIWNVAMKNGMKYFGFCDKKQVAEALRNSRGIIDLSRTEIWHGNTIKSVIEAMIWGTVPFCRGEGFGVDEEGSGGIFKPENVILLPMDKSISKSVDKGLQNEKKCEEIIERNYEFVKRFDCKKIAAQFLELASGKKDVGYKKKLYFRGKEMK